MKRLTSATIVYFALSSAFAAGGSNQITIEDLEFTIEKAPKCALIGSRFSEIITDLRAVTDSYDGKCVSRAEELITGIQSDVGSIEELSTAATAVTGEDAPSLSLEQTQRLQGTLDSISGLLSDRQCRTEFQESGFLPVLANTVQTVSRIAILAPNGESVAIGLGGSILSTTLRLINNALKPKFRWNDEKDRNAFLKFNCSYQMVKSKIDQQGVYNLKDLQLDREIGQTNTRIAEIDEILSSEDSITAKLKVLDAQLQAEILAAKTQRETLVLQEAVGVNYLEASRQSLALINEIQEKLSDLDYSQADTNTKVTLFRNITQLRGQLIESMQGIKPAESNIFDTILFENVLRTLAELAPEKAVELISIDTEAYSKLTASIKEAATTLSSIETNYYAANTSLLTSDKMEQLVGSVATEEALSAATESEKQELIQSNSEAYESELDLIAERDNLNAQLDILNSQKVTQETQARFTALNAGVENETSIYELDRLNAGRIYGPIGYSFMRYLLEESQEGIDTFESNFERFSENLSSTEFEAMNDSEKLTYCMNLQEIKKIYVSSALPTEMAYDFAATNLNLFHTLHKGTRVLTDERLQLRRQAFSAIYAKSLIDLFNSGSHPELQTARDLKTVTERLMSDEEPAIYDHSIGVSMINSVIFEQKALELQRQEQRYCANY